MTLKQWVLCSLMSVGVIGCTSSLKPAPAPEVPDKQTETAQINVQLGLNYLQKKDPQQAKERFLTALKMAPNLPEAWYSMGYFFESTGDIEKANGYYLKSVKLAPNRGDVQNNYGTFLCRHKYYKDSIQHFMLAIKDPDYLDTASAYENAGICSITLNIPNAIAYFNKAIQEDHMRPTALIELSRLYYKQGNYELSKKRLNEFLAISEATPASNWLKEELKKHG